MFVFKVSLEAACNNYLWNNEKVNDIHGKDCRGGKIRSSLQHGLPSLTPPVYHSGDSQQQNIKMAASSEMFEAAAESFLLT